MIINDLVTGITAKLANRLDITASIPRWTREVVLELTENYPFEELMVKGPASTLTSGIAEYDASTFVNAGDKATRIVTLWILTSTTSTTRSQLKYRVPQVVEQMGSIPGMPSVWSRVGNASTSFIVGPVPNQNYPFQIKYQRQHPFTTLQSPPTSDPILMPDSWQDIVEYAVAQRGAIDKRMLDYASNFHNILYGDPDFRTSGGTKGTPGLIFKRTSQRDRDSDNNERQLKPMVSRYQRR